MRIWKWESGQVAMLTAISIGFFLIAFAALVVDIGFLYATRRNMQTAADAAAIAGSNALQNELVCDSGNCPAAQNVAALNGYTNGVDRVTVKVGPPATKPNPSNGTFVEVDVEQAVPTFFLRAVGVPTVNVGVKAVAGYAPSPNCMIALSSSAHNAFVASGGSRVEATSCNIIVDSSSTDGLVVSGGSTIDAVSVGVVASSESQATSGVTPPFGSGSSYGIASVVDPLDSLVAPKPGTCTPSTAKGKGYTATGGETIGPGTYCGGIIDGGKTLFLNPGLYILLGGGLTVSGGGSLIGSGVTLFNTRDALHAYKPIIFSGGSSTNLSAPTGGTYNGILFFQDPAIGLDTKHNAIQGGGSAIFQGALYFPTTPLEFSGGSSINPENVTLIADTITLSGGSTYIGTGAPVAGQTPPITTSRLYE